MPTPLTPELELFHLDDCFTDIRTRLVRLADNFEDDLAHYVQEAGWILGVDGGCHEDDEEKAKHVLHAVAKMILQSKMHSNESR